MFIILLARGAHTGFLHFSLQLWSPVTASRAEWSSVIISAETVDCILPPPSHISHTAFSRPPVPVTTVANSGNHEKSIDDRALLKENGKL